MKKILLLITTTITLTAESQTSTYYPFPESNAYWNIVHFTNTNVDGTYGDFFSSFLNADTIINGKIYHKLYDSGFRMHWDQYSNLIGSSDFSNVFDGAIRQDT